MQQLCPRKQKTTRNMSHVLRITPGLKLKEGYVTLIGSTGLHYENRALEIPGHGLVPCSKKLTNNFTNDSSELIVVVDDDEKYVTSSMWVTRVSKPSFGLSL